MAEKKSIHEFSTGTPQAQTAFVVDTPSPSAESGYVTEKVITSDLGNTLLGTLNYTQALETDSKNIFGAINELKESGGGGSVDFVEEAIPEIPTRELPYYPSGEYSSLNTTDKHIVGAINEVKAKKLEYWTLIYKEPADNTTHKAVTLQNGRKFSDYDFIIFNCMSGGLVRNSLVRPSTRFSSDKETLEVDFSTSTETRWACLHFVSDTTAEVWSYASGVTIDLYGMKIS